MQNLTNDKRAAIAEQARVELARRSMKYFTTYTKDDYEMNWHHEELCNALDRLISGESKRLMVFMPPRHGKTELVSRRFPAYLFGRDPDAQIIAASYSQDLASRNNRDVQRIIDSDEYKEVFPEVGLNGSNIRTVANGSYLRNSDIFEIVGKDGVYKSAGIGGGITGMGMKYGIIDDPIKNRQDAESKTIRDHMWDWYTSVFYTRLEKDARILITLTRWHHDDIAGRLLRLAEEDPNAEQWDIISYPAIAESDVLDETDPREEGEPLWPGKYDKDALEKMKISLGSYQWAGLYQQKPSPTVGNLFNRSDWKFYDTLPDLKEFETVVQSWDCAFKDLMTSDFVVGQVWGKKGADKYLIDQVRERMDITKTMKAIETMSEKYPEAKAKLIEDKANGSAVIQMLNRKISGLIPINPQGGKVVRAQAVSPEVESGNIFLPKPSAAPWIGGFIEECATFPNGEHDDQVDTFTQAINNINGRLAPVKPRAASVKTRRRR